LPSKSSRLFDAGVPVAPAGGEQILDVAAMAGQLHAVHGESGTVQALAEQRISIGVPVRPWISSTPLRPPSKKKSVC
jgi:hypothetical protein